MISSSRYRTNRNLVLAWLATTTLSIGAIGGSIPAYAQETASYDIPAGPLSTALNQFARQAQVELIYDAPLTQTATSPGLKGSYDTAEALSLLLAESGVTFRRTGPRIFTLARTQQTTVDGSAVTLGPLQVEGDRAARENETGVARDARRKDAIYDQDISTTFASREEVERYKGANPADVLKGMVNVFSGDARNSGALDPSIRGIQGPGRVPVIIDGTEQAITVWRGYNGAGNRSYIDPSLISGIQVLKGPVSERGVNASTGGAVVVNTLDASDILKPGQTFGLELKLEGGNNSTNPRWPTLSTGLDYRNVPGFLGTGTGFSSPTYPYNDQTLRVTLRSPDDNEAFSFGDRAIRLAVAGRVGDFDLFGAYAFRERGNYFTGKSGAGYYQQEELLPAIGAIAPENYVRTVGLFFKPGYEVPNTSSELESFLLKGTWRIADGHSLQLGFRDSKSNYGEVMPSRLMNAFGFGNIQWPESKVHIQAYNAEYAWKPESPWIDLKATLWATDSVSDTYSAGGFPNAASLADPIIINSALANARNDRFGITASNQFTLSQKLGFVVEGNWQHEKLRSDDEYSTAIANGFRQVPRAGRREEYRINLRGEWRPASFLKLNAGITYSGYWAKDDFLPELIELRGGSLTQYATTAYAQTYQTTISDVAGYTAWQRNELSTGGPFGINPLSGAALESRLAALVASYAANPRTLTATWTGPWWEADENGRFTRADNVCLNGSLDTVAGYNGVCRIAQGRLTSVAITEAKRKSAHGWTPSASATIYLSGSSRLYARYAEALRFPSMFESTIGFSASINPFYDIKPERMRSWEAAWIQDLRPLLGLIGEGQHADLKLSWYHNTTRNVIERNNSFMFTNVDKQVIAGFEVQARFDNGRIFADIGASHMTKNQVCDESSAVTRDPTLGRVPDCVKYGFPAGYLLTQATPETTVNLHAGARFFERRLELGGRMAWYSAYDNPLYATFLTERIGLGTNIPYSWGEIVTFDAYATFRLNDRLSAELVGTNLNNRYYLDPLSRSLNPAPGRTVRLSLTGRI